MVSQESTYVGAVRVRYTVDGVGPPLLLLHGLIGSVDNWRRNTDSLSRDATVYALDLPNMGLSDRVEGMDATLWATAKFVFGFMDELGLRKVDVAAHSRGGAVALMMASLGPERVRSLMLFAPANPFCWRSRGILRFYRTWPGRAFARSVPWLPTWVKAVALGRMYGDSRRVPKDALPGYIEGLQIPGTIGHVLRIIHSWTDDMRWLEQRLERLRQPVLLIWGDRDRAVGVESGFELQRHLVRAELRLLRGVGHIAFEEVPEQVNPVMERWLRGLSESRVDGVVAS